MLCALSSLYCNVQSEAKPTQHYPIISSYLVVLYSLAAHPSCGPAAPAAQWRVSPPARGCVWAAGCNGSPPDSSAPLCLWMQRCKHMQYAEEITLIFSLFWYSESGFLRNVHVVMVFSDKLSFSLGCCTIQYRSVTLQHNSWLLLAKKPYFMNFRNTD